MTVAIDLQPHPWRCQGAFGVPVFHSWPGRDEGAATEFYRVDDGYVMRYPGVADFHLHARGNEVQCWPAAEGVAWQALYEQQVLPLAMAQAGAHVFHGGAVAIDGGAVAFVGRSGLGKSTLVAAFAARGYAFFADDCLLLEESDRGVTVRPHVANIRLWSDSLTAVAPAGCDVQRTAGSPKPRLLAGDAMPHATGALPLRRVYVLGEGAVAQPLLVPLSPADAVIGWASNRFVLDIKDRQLLAANLRWAAHRVADIPACLLDYPRRYDALDDVVAAVVADAAGGV